mmetsp:Transcript_26376/g.62802  ORF Transcript_26376/g.62802 Transcript_26376/m.62802 type:complete len:80 (+) Transcript_26376:1737-1976(+)
MTMTINTMIHLVFCMTWMNTATKLLMILKTRKSHVPNLQNVVRERNDPFPDVDIDIFQSSSTFSNLNIPRPIPNLQLVA